MYIYAQNFNFCPYFRSKMTPFETKNVAFR